MKRNSGLLILGLFFIMMACSQREETVQKVTQSFDRIVYLNSLDKASKGLYLYSLSWVYPSTNADNKAALREISLVEIPELKEQRKSLAIDVKEGAELDEILIRIDSLIAMAMENAKALQSVENYYDENGEWSETWKLTEVNLDTKMTPFFRDIEQKLAALIAAEEKTISEIFESSTELTEAKTAYAGLSKRFEVQRMNLKLYIEAVNWVYRPGDTQSKESLTNNLKAQIQLEDGKGQASNEEIIKSSSAMRDQIMSIKDSLVTEANYENPTTKFLAENALESDIHREFLNARFHLDESIKSEVEWFGLLVSGKADASKQ